MTLSVLTRLAAFSTCLIIPAALAQTGPAYISSTTPFLSSSFCTKIATCMLAGNIKLASGVTRSFFTVKLRKPQRYGPPSYTIYLDRFQNKQKVSSAAIMYPPAQDVVEDGTFFKTFISFMTGYDVNRASKDAFACNLQIRGQSSYFAVAIDHISAGYASEEVVTINDMGSQGAQMFDGTPASTRILVAENCT